MRDELRDEMSDELRDESPGRNPSATAVDEFDVLLQKALGEMTAALPSADFEQRLLAAARSDMMRIAPRIGISRWRLAAGLAVAATLLVTVASYQRGHRMPTPPKPMMVNVLEAPPAPPLTQQRDQQEQMIAGRLAPGSAAPMRAIMPSISANSGHEASPKLDTFPSPDPVAEAALRHHAPLTPTMLRGEAARALLALEARQAEDLTVAAITIIPLTSEEEIHHDSHP